MPRTTSGGGNKKNMKNIPFRERRLRVGRKSKNTKYPFSTDVHFVRVCVVVETIMRIVILKTQTIVYRKKPPLFSYCTDLLIPAHTRTPLPHSVTFPT